MESMANFSFPPLFGATNTSNIRPGTYMHMLRLTNNSMANTSSSADSLPATSLSELAFYAVVSAFLPALICSLGIVGNMVTMIVFERDQKKMHGRFRSMQLMLGSDTVLLSAVVILEVVPTVCFMQESINAMCRRIGFARVYAWPFICISQVTSAWFTVLSSSNCDVERPRTGSKMVSRSPGDEKHGNVCRKYAGLGIMLFAGILNIPKFLEYHYQVVMLPGNVTYVYAQPSSWRTSAAYQYAYNIGIYGVCLYVVPIALLIHRNSSSPLLTRRHRRGTMEEAHSFSSISQSLILVSTITDTAFIVCGILSYLVLIVEAVCGPDMDNPIFDKFVAVTNLFIILKASGNFAFFMSASTRFRHAVLRCLRCQNSVNRKTHIFARADLEDQTSVIERLRARHLGSITETIVVYDKRSAKTIMLSSN